MRLRWGSVAAAALLASAATAWAAGTEVAGLGFRARAPADFVKGTSEDEDGGCNREFRRGHVGGGELVLKYCSHTQNDAELAKTEMNLSRGLEATAIRMDIPDAEPVLTEAHVPGAEEAFEVVGRGADATSRLLTARVGKLLVTVTLDSPARAEEDATEAWGLVTASLRVEEPSIQAGTIVLWVLGALVLVAVMVRVAKRSKPQPFTPGRSSYTPTPTTPVPVRHEPEPIAPLPADVRAAAAPRARSGLSRADDGLPVFTPEAKAAGVDPEAAVKLLVAAPKVVKPPPPSPATARTGNLKPPAPAVRIVKGYSGGGS